MKTTQTLLSVVALCTGLLAISTEAGAALENHAEYSVRLQAVQASGAGSTTYPGSSDSQSSYSYAPYSSLPVPVQVAGSANTGTNQNGLGYAVGHGYARAEAGVLKAYALAEAQAVSNPTTNVGAGVVVSALAKFTDLVTFGSAGSVPYNALIVSGNLLLTGNMSGSYARVKVGGTGLNPQRTYAEWIGEIGRQQSALGDYSSWVPGSPLSIPFSFTVNSGQATELSYWLDVYASAGANFQPCVDSLGGGICDVAQMASSVTNVDYSHTLAWGGVHVTDWFGTPVNFSVSSKSGFDYANPYVSSVPVPAAAWLLGSGLLGLISVARRKRVA